MASRTSTFDVRRKRILKKAFDISFTASSARLTRNEFVSRRFYLSKYFCPKPLV